jgi:hypothetical protein
MPIFYVDHMFLGLLGLLGLLGIIRVIRIIRVIKSRNLNLDHVFMRMLKAFNLQLITIT